MQSGSAGENAATQFGIRRCGAWRRTFLAFALLAAAGASGCAQFITAVTVSAPNRFNPLAGRVGPSPVVQNLLGVDGHFWVEVGPPRATLSISVIEPRTAPRGTILVMHGVRSRGFWLLERAHTLADAGYRAILVDLRGHGHSSGQYLTYGIHDSRDMSQVIDALEQRGLLAGRLGAYGMSYGAATALQLAALDPRVDAVVALASFSSMREEVPDFVRAVLPGIGRRISEQTIQRAVDDAGYRGNFDPDMADPSAAIRQTHAPVLLMHGTNDRLAPIEHAWRLREAGGDHTEFIPMPGLGHLGIWRDPKGEVARHTIRWFDQWLAVE